MDIMACWQSYIQSCKDVMDAVAEMNEATAEIAKNLQGRSKLNKRGFAALEKHRIAVEKVLEAADRLKESREMFLGETVNG